jgi:hypothetical protein
MPRPLTHPRILAPTLLRSAFCGAVSCTGQIVGAVGDCYLIQFDKLETDQPRPPVELYTLGELSAIYQNCDQKLANLFKSRDDMMRWIAWLTKPEKLAGQSGKVVHLKKPH